MYELVTDNEPTSKRALAIVFIELYVGAVLQAERKTIGTLI